jgi:hypothetical protein
LKGIFLVPVIAVFTKYEQFKREISFKLEDQGIDTITDPALLRAEVERIFESQYLAKLMGPPPVVCLESEDFENQLACTTLISVMQGCTRRVNGVRNLPKRRPMNSQTVSLPSCSWPFRRTI